MNMELEEKPGMSGKQGSWWNILVVALGETTASLQW